MMSHYIDLMMSLVIQLTIIPLAMRMTADNDFFLGIVDVAYARSVDLRNNLQEIKDLSELPEYSVYSIINDRYVPFVNDNIESCRNLLKKTQSKSTDRKSS